MATQIGMMMNTTKARQSTIPLSVRFARGTYGLASFVFVFIGVMHNYVQWAQLSTPEIQAMLGAMDGQEGVSMWRLFVGLSYLMGVFSIGIGLTNLTLLFGSKRSELPPLGSSIVCVLVLACVTTVGVLWLGPIQAGGGPFGIFCFGVPIVMHLRARGVR